MCTVQQLTLKNYTNLPMNATVQHSAPACYYVEPLPFNMFIISELRNIIKLKCVAVPLTILANRRPRIG
jgi:hypothetical protein